MPKPPYHDSPAHAETLAYIRILMQVVHRSRPALTRNEITAYDRLAMRLNTWDTHLEAVPFIAAPDLAKPL